MATGTPWQRRQTGALLVPLGSERPEKLRQRRRHPTVANNTIQLQPPTVSHSQEFGEPRSHDRLATKLFLVSDAPRYGSVCSVSFCSVFVPNCCNLQKTPESSFPLHVKADYFPHNGISCPGGITPQLVKFPLGRENRKIQGLLTSLWTQTIYGSIKTPRYVYLRAH